MNISFDPVRSYARTKPDRLAVGDAETGDRWSWRELDTAVDRIAAWLVSRLGPASSARVAVLGRNHPLQLVLQFACARAGAIFVPLNWRLTTAELKVIIDDADPELIFYDNEFLLPNTNCELHLITELNLLGEQGASPPSGSRLGWDAPITLLYTSGTSGRPKGVIVTEANAFWSNVNFALGSMVSHTTVFLCDMPMFHTAGLFAAIRVPIWAGGSVWISAGFDPQRTITRIADPELGITHYFSVPQMATTLWQHPDFAPEKFSHLAMYVSGGAPNPPIQLERFVRAGIRFSDGFGMTETGSSFGMPVNDPERLIAKAGSCGQPFNSMEARIVDEKGNDVANGAVGELWLRGPSVTPGYWNQPELTAKAFHEDWFKTGDAARQDHDGFYYIVDRRKDMYISGGENVYPAEVEAVIAQLPEVAEIAVIGIPHEKWGETGCAFIVARANTTIDFSTVEKHCLERLAKFKVPSKFILTPALPRTGSGKVQKHLLQVTGSADFQNA